MNIENVEGSAALGWNISEALQNAQRRASENASEVRFEFNECELRVRADSPISLLHRDFTRRMKQYHSDPVGPYPPQELSPEVQARDAEIQAERDRRDQERQREYEAKQEAKRIKVEKEIEGVEMAVRDDDAWTTWREKNQDPYGGACVSYAERWARLMQARMSEGKLIAEVAEQASHDADVEGITGFMYGVAVSILAAVWEHGEALRLWHNLKCQIGNEGEKANDRDGAVLNPALLTIG